MPDIASVVESLRENDDVYRIANSPTLSFVNASGAVYLGAQLMPEETQPLNRYDEEDFIILDMIARDAERYSPVRYRGTAAVASAFEVVLGDSDTGRQMSPREYEMLVSLQNSNASIDDMANRVLDFAGSLTRSLITFNEKQRWQAIVTGQIQRRIGAAQETISYPSAPASGSLPAQRSALTDAWSSDTVDPFDFIDEKVMGFAAEMGYNRISRIISRRKPWTVFKNNANVMRRSGLSFNSTNDAEYFRGRASSGSAVNQMLQDENYPTWEVYEDTYRDEDGRHFYLPDDAVVFVFDTGVPNETLLDLAEENALPLVPNAAQYSSIGYTGIGTVATQQRPGRIVSVAVNSADDIVQFVRGGGKQTGLPVFRHPTGFMVATVVR